MFCHVWLQLYVNVCSEGQIALTDGSLQIVTCLKVAFHTKHESATVFPSSLFSAVISPVFTLMILVGGEVGVMTADFTDRSLLMVMENTQNFLKCHFHFLSQATKQIMFSSIVSFLYVCILKKKHLHMNKLLFSLYYLCCCILQYIHYSVI